MRKLFLNIDPSRVNISPLYASSVPSPYFETIIVGLYNLLFKSSFLCKFCDCLLLISVFLMSISDVGTYFASVGNYAKTTNDKLN